ncbi:cell division protein FtsW [Constrictibacter sp. MBR-5]|jgi:cell division protein FtsW|uniref:FtsW/RodA/SpoVE family cell cycle protein n=1 Tax=Constrictibacter sp. MBR-5 TaxID=3156467 RepID=UPI003398079D
MTLVARTDTSVIGRWWWTVDRWALSALVILMLVGAWLVVTASPPVAERLGYGSFHFAKRHLIMLPVAATILIGASLLSPRGVLRVGAVVFAISLLLLAATLVVGVETKGARRWINIAGFSMQPSEFVKPAFAIVAAWLFAEGKRDKAIPGHWIAFGLYFLVVTLIIAQPDLGMTMVVTSVWLAQFFLAGLSMWLVIGLGLAGIAGLFGAYFMFPHVTSRIDRFLDPASGDSYQIDKSLSAFVNGGFLGRGPGVGRVKETIPDAHADFVFAVAGEEMGAIVCLIIVGLFAFLVIRCFARLLAEQNLFVFLAVAGLVTNFGLQAVINIGSSLHLLPTKGMTLPFISYGGSSLLALALTMGMALALTRRRVEPGGML